MNKLPKFVIKAIKADLNDNTGEATDYILKGIRHLQSEGKYAEIDEIHKNLDVKTVSLSVCITILSASRLTRKDQYEFQYRQEFFNKIQARMDEEHKTPNLLDGMQYQQERPSMLERLGII